MKRLLIFGLMAVIVSLAIVSCKDDFNEEEFLKLQSDLKLKQDTLIRARQQQLLDSTSEKSVKEYVAAINEAGDLLAVTIMVRENGVPVPGVTVSMTSSTANAISSGRAQALQSVVTDAAGNAVFDRVAIGSGTISFSKNGYITATGLVDFGTPGLPQAIPVTVSGNTITKYLPPTKRFEEAVVQMFSATAGTGSTGTITGRVSIENDVTNTTAEVPAGVVIRANLTNLVTAPGGFITSLQFADDSALGVATVAANGTYTMTVPATASGTTINLIVPNIEGTSRMAVNAYDNGTGTAVALTVPEYRDVPTAWGPQAPIGFGTTIPQVAGARIVVPAPPAQGSGLSFALTPVGRSLPTGSFSNTNSTSLGAVNEPVEFRITNRGTYSGPAPSVAITEGGGSGAVATATLKTRLTSLVVTNPGDGYPATVQLRIIANLSGGGSQFLSTSGDIATVNGGKLPSIIDLDAVDGGNSGFGLDDIGNTNLPSDAASVQLVIVSAAPPAQFAQFTPTFVTELNSINITNGGSGYTSAPTITLSGGGTTNQATASVIDFPVFWNIEPVNGAGSDYPLIPAFSIAYPHTSQQNATTSSLISGVSAAGIVETTPALQSALNLSAGDLVKKFPALSYRTTFTRSVAPTINITQEVPEAIKLNFQPTSIDADGKITSNPSAVTFGNGYNSTITAAIVPTITGAPGSGATLTLSNTFDAANREYTWSLGITIPSAGSGYLQNLNQKAPQAVTFPTSQVVQAGKSYTLDINYGTGQRRVSVN